MALQLYKVSVPGSLMLLGEHAVLANKQAIVCAVDKRINMQLTPDSSNKIKIFDSNLGYLEQDLDDLCIKAPFQFVLSSILLFAPRIKTGFTLTIESEFSSKIGFGSSAAVTIATIAVLTNWLYSKQLSEKKIFLHAKKAILNIQGIGSGADLAASLYGGVINYQPRPFKCTKLPIIPALTAVYCGYKKPTREVIDIVNAAKQRQPQVYASIFEAMQVCVSRATTAIKQGDFLSLGQLFMHHQGLQYALGVSNKQLDQLISQICDFPEIFGAKISGSGLGDCIVGLGTLRQGIFPVDEVQKKQGVLQIPVNIDHQGLLYEHN